MLRPAIKALDESGAVSGGDAAKPAAAPPPEPDIRWAELRSTKGEVLRAKVPGGWLVSFGQQLTFVPDAGHAWDGKTLE